MNNDSRCASGPKPKSLITALIMKAIFEVTLAETGRYP
jgi:hypothetical protein